MSVHLLDLPVEILRQILRPLLTASDSVGVIRLCPCHSHPLTRHDQTDDGLTPPPPQSPFFGQPVLPILLAHARIHAVACPLLYEINRFTLDLTGDHHAHVRRWMKDRKAITALTAVEKRQEDMLPPLREVPTLLGTTDALRRISRLEVRVDRLRSWIQDAVVPLVADMTLRGSLRRLDLRVSRAGRKEALLRPPLSGLVGLLADPYLDSARLWIIHGGSSSSSNDWEGFHLDEEGEVDWRAVVRHVDPEGDVFPDMAVGAQRGRYYYC